MLTSKDERRLVILERNQAYAFSPDRQIHIDSLKRKQIPSKPPFIVVETDQEFDRGVPDEPTGVYTEPTKRSAGEYAAYLANDK